MVVDTRPGFYRKFGTLLRVDLDPLTNRLLIAESIKRVIEAQSPFDQID